MFGRVWPPVRDPSEPVIPLSNPFVVTPQLLFLLKPSSLRTQKNWVRRPFERLQTQQARSSQQVRFGNVSLETSTSLNPSFLDTAIQGMLPMKTITCFGYRATAISPTWKEETPTYLARLFSCYPFYPCILDRSSCTLSLQL